MKWPHTRAHPIPAGPPLAGGGRRRRKKGKGGGTGEDGKREEGEGDWAGAWMGGWLVALKTSASRKEGRAEPTNQGGEEALNEGVDGWMG